MTGSPAAPSGPSSAPARYGAGLAVLVVGTGAEPFASADPLPVDGPAAAPSPPAARTAGDLAVVLVDSRAPGGPPAGVALPVVRIGEDIGRGAAVNRAVAGLPPEIGLVAVAPPGLAWADGALAALHAAAMRHPRAGILAPRVHDRTGAVLASTHPLPRPGRGLVAVLAGRSWPRASAADPTIEAPIGWSSAPAMVLRRAALDSVDRFDPRYAGRLDDLDLADRLAAAGWLTVHVPSATVVYVSPPRPDRAAPRRYLRDRTARPLGALLRTTAP